MAAASSGVASPKARTVSWSLIILSLIHILVLFMYAKRFIIINLVYNNKPFLSIYIAAIFFGKFQLFSGFSGQT